ncbi:MAG: HNH endonuclease signature motif containing protein [bacterium]
MKSIICSNCNKQLETRSQLKYCSNKCQKDFQYNLYIKEWKLNKIKTTTKNISKHLKRYFLEKHGEKCSLCGWQKRNQVTKNVPLEIDHIDGNSINNKENNLRLLCPNCHALTPNFKSLNKGKGRSWRVKK